MKHAEERQAFSKSEHLQCVGSSATAPFTHLSTGKCRTLTLLVLLLLCALAPLAAQTRAKLQRRAEAGDAEAQYKLGYCYDWGQSKYFGRSEEKPRDIEKAMYWYKKAAAQGYGDAYFSLALIYEINIEDKDEAIYWYKKDADHWYEKYGDLDGIAIENLKELGVDYDPRTKRSRSTADASDGSSRRSSGSTFDYTMSKGEVVIPKVYNNGGGYGGYDSGSSNYSPGRNSSGSTGSSSTSRRQCSLCHGTGRIVHENYTATYGYDRKMRCNECGKDYWASSGHSHITCTQCHGKGYF